MTDLKKETPAENLLAKLNARSHDDSKATVEQRYA